MYKRLPSLKQVITDVLNSLNRSKVIDTNTVKAIGEYDQYIEKVARLTTKPPEVPSTRKIDTGEGLSGGGDLSQDRTHKLNFGGLDSLQSLQLNSDVVAVFDTSAVSHKKMYVSDLFKVLTNSQDTTPGHLTDKLKEGTNITLEVVDVDGAKHIKINSSGGGGGVPSTRKVDTGEGLSGGGDLSSDRTHTLNFGGLDLIQSIQLSSDVVAIFDHSESHHKKMYVSDLFKLLTNSQDSTPEYLTDKLKEGTNITLEVVDVDGVKHIKINSSASGVPTSRKVSTGEGLSGGGDLSQDRTHTLNFGGLDLVQTLQLNGDVIAVLDHSESHHKKMYVSELFKLLTNDQDSTQGYLVDKLQAGTNITLEVVDVDGVKKVKISSSGGGSSSELVFDPTLTQDHTVSGIVATLVAGENLVFGNVCYVDSYSKYKKAYGRPCRAMAIETITANNSGKFLLQGYVRDDSLNLTVGESIYPYSGAVSPIPGDMQTLGYAIATNKFYFHPSSVYLD